MIREITATGATVDAARQAAETALGAGPDADVQFEIIALPQKKTFGIFGGSPAKVRAYYDDGQPEPTAPPARQPRRSSRAARKPAISREREGRAARPTERAAAQIKPAPVPEAPIAKPKTAAQAPAEKNRDYRSIALERGTPAGGRKSRCGVFVRSFARYGN